MDIIFNKLKGSELKEIWEVSGLGAAEFAKELKISRSLLYTHFDKESIPDEIEARLDGNPDLYKYRKMLKLRESDSDVNGNRFNELMSALTNTVKIASAALESNNRQLTIIEKDHGIFQELISQGIKDGILKFSHPTKKAG